MDDSKVFLAQLAAEFREKLRRGESPEIEPYADRYPQLADQIRQLFPTLLLMEQSAASGDPQGGKPSADEAAAGAGPSPSDSDQQPVDATASATTAISAAPPDAPERPLGTFGDYELLEKIASGGMGVVYRARQRSLNRIVALKMIRGGQLASREEILRFHAEAEAAANLRHPNIVTIYEIGELEGQHYFSMDYIHGESLTEIMSQKGVTPDQAAEYLHTIALAIEYAHQHGVVHRDLKPSNILIDASGQPKVTDFGLAKRIDRGVDLTMSGSLIGSPPYMSPEQAAGKKEEVGPASDVYSLGTILYQLLTGRPPFQGDTPLETIYQVLETEPTAPRVIDREIPRDLETLCLKCMAKDPKDRYASAGEFAEELGRYLAGEPILTRPPGLAGGASGLTWWIAGAIVAAVLFAFAAPQAASAFYLGGEAFLRLLKMIVVPLVMASVMSGVISMGDVRRLGRPGAYTLVYFLATTLLAVLTGLLLVNLLRPGAGAFSADELEAAKTASVVPAADDTSETAPVGEDTSETAPAGNDTPATAPLGLPKPPTLGEAFQRLLLMLFPDNLFAAMAEGNLLPLIVFSIIFAGVLTTMGRRAETISRLITGANHALLSVVMLLMKIAPVGIFCLVAAQFGREVAAGTFAGTIRSLLFYVIVVLAALGVHFFITLPVVLFLLTRRNPYRFVLQMSEALLTAFSTASSSATLPVSMECAGKRARVSRRATEFVLPLGATINMDGTAAFEACAAVFIAQAFGLGLGPLEQFLVVVTAAAASIAAAGVPQAGLYTMLIVLNALGLPLEGIALIFAVDWLVDRFRTTVNVFGDAVGAAVVEKSFRT